MRFDEFLFVQHSSGSHPLLFACSHAHAGFAPSLPRSAPGSSQAVLLQGWGTGAASSSPQSSHRNTLGAWEGPRPCRTSSQDLLLHAEHCQHCQQLQIRVAPVSEAEALLGGLEMPEKILVALRTSRQRVIPQGWHCRASQDREVHVAQLMPGMRNTKAIHPHRRKFWDPNPRCESHGSDPSPDVWLPQAHTHQHL